MSAGPGIYALHVPIYDYKYPKRIISIKSSIDVGRSIKSNDYKTIFTIKDTPQFLWSIHPIDYESIAEIKFVEKIIHHQLKNSRLEPECGLFHFMEINIITNILDSLGIEYKVYSELPKSYMSYKELINKEKSYQDDDN
jgi:hypothetical protein